MYETEFITAGITIIVGVTVYVIGEILNQFMIKPIIELKEEIGRVASSLTYYAYIYSNPKTANRETELEASHELRLRASELRAKMNNVSKMMLSRCKLSKENIKKASEGLIFLSNALFSGKPLGNYEKRKEIENLLNIEHE